MEINDRVINTLIQMTGRIIQRGFIVRIQWHNGERQTLPFNSLRKIEGFYEFRPPLGIVRGR